MTKKVSQEISNTSKNIPSSPRINVVMLADAWFPSSEEGPGEFTGMQIHIKKLREALDRQELSTSELFFPANPNFVIRWSWAILVIFQVWSYSHSNRVDVIHSHGNLSALPGKIISILLKIPVVHTVHRFSDLDLEKKTPKALFQWLVLTKIRYSHQITISQSFLKQKNINTEITYIPNGISISEFNQVSVAKNADPTLIWVGHDDPSKGLEFLRRAITKLRQDIPNLQTDLVAGGRIQGRDLIKAYKKAHVFVLPSLTETLPMSLLEAWAAKLPVVTTTVGDLPNLVKNGVNGYLVEPANVNQLYKALLKIFRARTKNDRMGQAGYVYVKKHYSWKQVATKTNRVYLSTLT
jgi:glycosyltransferase involved in cell wall biosynthesis